MDSNSANEFEQTTKLWKIGCLKNKFAFNSVSEFGKSIVDLTKHISDITVIHS